MNVPTHEDSTALAALVRGGILTGEQREQTALVLDVIGSALRTVAQADNPASVAGAWQPVTTEYTRLLAAAAR